MARLAASDVSADADPELGQHLGNVSQPVGAYEQRVHVQSPLAKAAPTGLAHK
jgi:hypothetical protein